MEYGIFITGLYTGGAKRKEKAKLNGAQTVLLDDGYNMSISNGKGNFWRVKVADDPEKICTFGDVVRVRIDNVSAFNNSVYYSGEIVPELPS